MPNSGSYELCYPNRQTTVVGNLVYENNETDNPAIDVALLAQGNGILLAGAVQNVVEKNRVWDHDRTGIGLVPFPEEDANDLAPDTADWDVPCEETHDDEVPPIVEEDCKAVEGLLEGLCRRHLEPLRYRAVGNVVEGSLVADIAVGTADLLGTGETTDTLRNCFSGNTFGTTAPTDLEALAPCDGTGNGGDWNAGALDLIGLLGTPADAPPRYAYKTTPAAGRPAQHARRRHGTRRSGQGHDARRRHRGDHRAGQAHVVRFRATSVAVVTLTIAVVGLGLHRRPRRDGG